MKRTGPTNINTLNMIKEFKEKGKKEKKAVFLRIADELSKPKRREVCVNLSKISKLSKDKDVVLVVGKVLSGGELDHNVTIVAHKFSTKAKEKINSFKSKYYSLSELLKKKDLSKNIIIIK
jgi:large subunit ribosomal protein L18e